jgi:pyrroline-5-carboxylate reductase
VLKQKQIAFVGGGNMAEALIRGLIEASFPASQLQVSAPRQERLDELRDRYGVETSTDNKAVAAWADIVVVAVKPQIVATVLDEITHHLRDSALLISVAAGVTTSALESHLPATARVVRSMPNTPALVLAGATAICGGSRASETDLQIAAEIFGAVGIAEVLPESQLDAVTGLSGSGPAYIFLILEAMADAGVKVGLSRRNALRLAAQTVMGSAKLLLDTHGHPGQLKDMVTSPGGTAIAGLHTLEAGGLRTTLINAVEAATQRAAELGDKS